MSHRYAAGTLVILVLIINGFAWCYRRHALPRVLPLMLMGLIGFQAALGMWTVTLKLLPVVVMGHLLGGILIFGCLVYLNWLLSAQIGAGRKQWRWWVDLGVGIVFCQIALGGWVSANYAGIACVGFPQCNGQWLPKLDWYHSFQLWSPIGANYQGGLLDVGSRMTIQIIHRFGAGMTALYLILLSIGLFCCVRSVLVKRITAVLLGGVLLQWMLGIANVVWFLPLWVAVAHNAVAALLLATILSLRYCLLTGVTHVRYA